MRARFGLESGRCVRSGSGVGRLQELGGVWMEEAETSCGVEEGEVIDKVGGEWGCGGRVASVFCGGWGWGIQSGGDWEWRRVCAGDGGLWDGDGRENGVCVQRHATSNKGWGDDGVSVSCCRWQGSGVFRWLRICK